MIIRLVTEKHHVKKDTPKSKFAVLAHIKINQRDCKENLFYLLTANF